MIATTVRAELADLVLKFRTAGTDQQVEARGEIILLVAVADMEGIFAMLRPASGGMPRALQTATDAPSIATRRPRSASTLRPFFTLR